jgi:predicted Zn finger-like uncharacterized protein
MDVRCEKCQAEYTLDETLVSPTGTAVRCTNCGFVFRVSSKQPAEGGQATWTLRQANGKIVPFDRMSLLQDWISRGVVSREDMISRGGREWKRLADLAEMKPFFDAAELSQGTQPVGAGFPQAHGAEAHQPTIRHQIARGEETAAQRPMPTAPMVQIQTDKSTHFTPSAPPAPPKPSAPPAPMATVIERTTLSKTESPTVRAHSPSLPFAQTAVGVPAFVPSSPPPAHAPNAPQSHEPDLSMSQVPAAAEERWEAGRAPRVENPAWAEKQPHFPTPLPDDDEDAPPVKRHVGRWVALAIVLALVGAGFYVFMYRPELVRAALGRFVEAPDDTRLQAFFIKGRESFLLDTENAFVQADREYHKVLALDERHAPTLAALSEMYAVWAQYVVDQEYDTRIDAAVAKGSEPHLRDLARLKNEFDHKIADAERWGSQAVAAAPALPAAHLAMADVLRLKGDLAGAEEHLARADSPETADAKTYVAALIAVQKGVAPEELLEPIRRVAHSEAEPVLRALYREARILAATGKVAEAKEVLAKLLEVNSDHEMARDLAARIDAGQVVVLTEKAAAAEEQRLANADLPEVVAPPTPPSESPPKQVAAVSTGGGTGVGAGGGGAGGSPDAMLARAAKLQETGNTAEAKDLFERVLEQRPNDIDALSGLAYCYLDQGAKGQAIATFRRALAVNPSYGPAIIGLAETYKAQGQKDQALKYYKQYLSIHPSSKYSAQAERNAAELERELSESGAAPPQTQETPPEAPQGGAGSASPSTEGQPASGGAQPPSGAADTGSAPPVPQTLATTPSGS